MSSKVTLSPSSMTMTTTGKTSAPFGTWKSTISASSLAGSPPSPEQLFVDEATLTPYHTERRPLEGGRIALVDSTTRKDVLPSPWNVRTGVHEYGGGAVCARNHIIYFSNFADGRLYALDRAKGPDTQPTAVTPENENFRYADVTVHPFQPHILVGVLEDHTNADTPLKVVNKLVTINIQKQSVETLASGSDFYASPRFNPSGTRITWVQWNHPMPWDSSEIHIAECKVLENAVELTNDRIIGPGKDESAIYPKWLDDRRLLFNSDKKGFQNPYIFDTTSTDQKTHALFENPLEEEFSEPAWVIGESYSVVLAPDHLIFTAIRKGRGVLYEAKPITKNENDGVESPFWKLQEIESPFIRFHSLQKSGASSAMFIAEQIGAGATLVSLVSIADKPGVFQVNEHASLPTKRKEVSDKHYFSHPQTLEFTNSHGETVYAVFWPPTNPQYSAPADEKSPCIINIHGGPTGLAGQSLNMKAQFFTSRGVAYCELNYGGSSGFGRKYIERLDGQWGILDVTDSVDLAQYLSSSTSLPIPVDPARLVITGRSSGGYTVLQIISSSSAKTVFCGAISSYGIGNLFNLVKDTHKFEALYMEKLIGCKDTDKGGEEVYRERSPVFQADKIKTPLLLLQGSIDPVVPPEQSKEMAHVIEAHGGHAELVLFEGESHGWRQADTIERAVEEEWRFLKKVFKGKEA